jgi:hypothetical protein
MHAFDKGTRNARAENLRENGATDAETNFLLDYRVELNAMTSDQLVTFVERKLEHHVIKKVIPDDEELAEHIACSLAAKRSSRLSKANWRGSMTTMMPQKSRPTSKAAFASTWCTIPKPAGTQPCSTWWQTHQN